MKTPAPKTVSMVPIPKVSRPTRTTRQTLQTLTFIHRFRHVTAKHIQLSLRHAKINTTLNHLSLMRAKGYIDRQYTSAYHATNRPASYYLTPEGLSLLQAQYPDALYRGVRSVKSDATTRATLCARYHILANVYIHMKRHHDGFFEMFSSVDLSKADGVPEQLPDGYVRMKMVDGSSKHYFIEIYGYGRSTGLQERRLNSYLQFAESNTWNAATAEPQPNLLVVFPSSQTQSRHRANFRRSLENCLADNFTIYTAIASNLDSNESVIWRAV